jgi:hypothetical protein
MLSYYKTAASWPKDQDAWTVFLREAAEIGLHLNNQKREEEFV